ncbi:MAG: hypothetical protein CUN55_16960, partial [Phototrophicales bacterium]
NTPSERDHTSRGNVTEIVIPHTNSLTPILPMLCHLYEPMRWVTWINTPSDIIRNWRSKKYSRCIDQAKHHILLLHRSAKYSAFELAYQSLASGRSQSVILWANALTKDSLTDAQFKLLEEASEQGSCLGIILRVNT